MILFLKILFQAISGVGGFAIILLDYYNNDKRTKRFKQLRKGALWAFVFSMIGAIGFGVWDEYESNRNYRNIIDSIYGKGYGLISVLEEKKDSQNYQRLVFQNLTSEPIFDVVISFDKRGVEGEGDGDFDYFKTYNLGSVAPSRIIPLGDRFKIAHGEMIHHNFYIGTRNGVYRQELFCAQGRSTPWSIITRLFKYDFEKEKYQRIQLPEGLTKSADFPIPLDSLKWALDFE